MKFYNKDGTCKSDEDSSFGWWLDDIIACKPCDAKIAIFPIKSVQETLLDPEGFVKKVERCQEDFYYENSSALREKLTTMISPNVWENKLLLSVINFSLFKKLSESDPLDENLIKSNETLQTANRRIKANPGGAQKLNCPQSELLKLSQKTTCAEKYLECIAFLHRNLDILNCKIKEMQREVLHIKVFLEEENERSRILLRECRKFSQELKESNYLNEIVLLLMGKAEKIKSNNWPFRNCTSNNDNNELNLII
ncbi:hypothetical protein PPYR_08849 [Photinus pyralis]|uniref:Uncharacterized protein n=1 Tax=Photinus pyralis TaxID=7054 RepID=A0A5N4AKM7_PHOPY|nr:uncharacterized protein LOC116170647 [Photinus pyralis]KAB0797856.1 hypothetical protein PPYR_08849 [Photinus pyralis]